jgi:hypothetical protein
MEKILEGSLSRFEVPDLLNLLNIGQRTGVLVFERPDQETKLFFREGSPVYATSTKPELRFGSVLVRLGKMTSDQLERVIQRQRKGGYRIGQVLLWEKILKEEELASYLKVQVSEVIFDSFLWSKGVFTFYEKIPPPATAVTLEMDLQNLIMEGVRRIDDRARLPELFPDLNLVVELLANPERIKHTVTLTPEEWQVFFLIDGRRTLAEIGRLAGNPDEPATLLIIHHLLAAKFLRLSSVSALPMPVLPPQPADADSDGTQALREARATPAVAGVPVSVEFSSGQRSRKAENDDSREIVNPKAMKYLGDSRKLTVSRLVLMKDGNERSFPLTRDSYTLGRHRNNDILITDPKISSFHARIDRSAEGFVLVDLNSLNGTFLNGKKIETGLLKTGDELRLGTARLMYKVDYTSSV